MNNKQKKILLIVVGVILVMLIFPPFQVTYQAGVVDNLGYRFILSPPTDGDRIGTVNIGLLSIQWVGAALIGTGIIFAAKD